ncbi:AI-2E family transporter [Aurantibacter crassamenti]|uniref:AI-2E family transporter n=1 Tax=Aurantibacter crassamenti TaxID=1837375 RepID=UPI00193AD770|nr:AI-2E family transporter [Aurantibacter crassamenti]MBM1104572.1 AI-2E family transporter [Aurantibacter crassamenti]
MKSNTIARGILKAIAVFVGVVLLCFFIYKVQSVIAYVVIAGVVALLGRPIVALLRRKLKFPNTMAVIFTMLVIFGLLLGVLALFIPLLSDQGDNLSFLNMKDMQNALDKLYNQITGYFGASPKVVDKLMEGGELEKNLMEELDMGFVPKFLNSLFEILSSFGIGLFSVLFISFFFLKDSKFIQGVLLKIIPKPYETKAINSIESIKNLLSRYFVGLTFQILILFVIYSVVLLVVGVENAIVIALLCALFNIIPYLGPMIGAGVMVLLTMISFLDQDFSLVILPNAGYVLLGVVIGQLVDNFFSQPLIFSHSVKSHPLEIFLVIVIAGLLFGVVGMIVAVPGYTVVKVILKEFMLDYRWVKAITKGL